MKTLILTDNLEAVRLAHELQGEYGDIDIYQSPSSALDGIPRINVKNEYEFIITNYALVLSLHCKQIFPEELVSRVRCVNVHPGYNPYNRGWFPHVFSIINGLKAGITIHEMDEHVDHGPIIVQREYTIKSWDTSESVYENIIEYEKELVLEWYTRIRDHLYTPYFPQEEGNVNYKLDYERLKHLDLNRVGRFGDFLNLLRALSHGSYRNAYFIDADGHRVYVRVNLELYEASDETKREN